ncbi:hypothetical protein RRG08_049936 [Elysia crispata]|uniref:Uncharacterized protein n=1 Tax=Elysia crispata TaxID=231223 RepID=A0AAE0XZT2_9GAST|nr:hypothetical protein RRG08_049936 [Elysia crispata]
MKRAFRRAAAYLHNSGKARGGLLGPCIALNTSTAVFATQVQNRDPSVVVLVPTFPEGKLFSDWLPSSSHDIRFPSGARWRRPQNALTVSGLSLLTY